MNFIKDAKNHLLLLKKLKNTESAQLWNGFLKTDFNRYSRLCQHKNWFAELTGMSV